MSIKFKNLKIKLNFIISIAFIFSLILSTNVFAESNVPEIKGEGMVLMDGTTGEVLAEKNANEKLAPASTTKTMTALLTVEKANLNDVVTIGKNPPLAEGTRVGLQEGDKYTVEELLNALLIQSANDAAVALAEHISGSEEKFAKLMNERAEELGAKNTHFVNASGLFEDDHMTTPYDLALIMNVASKNPIIDEITKKTVYEMPKSIVSGEPIWANNNNQLIHQTSPYYNKDIFCNKTGYTTKSRHTFTCAAKRGDRKLILTLLGYDTKDQYYEDTKNLLDYGFDNFSLVKLYSKNDVVKEYYIDDKNTLSLVVPEDIYKTFKNSEIENLSTDEIKKNLNIDFSVKATKPISRGTDILKDTDSFTGTLMIGNTPYKTLNLLNSNDITYTSFEKLMFKLKGFSGFYIALGVIGLIFLIILILFMIRLISTIKRIRNRKKRNSYFYN
ncbi:D-alanyl-D-alanine carboxypeptidase [Clostridium perfringens]|nr:D-alanyl-D-alanine carboxypeptidase [Clostridium perfringens]